MFRVLHLSDIHIGKMYQQIHHHKEPAEVAHRIASDACSKLRGQPINCIVVTGDIFDGRLLYPAPENRNNHFERMIWSAVNFFRVLLDDIKTLQDNKNLGAQDVLFVPGNHDILRNTVGVYEIFNKFLLKFYDIENMLDYHNKSFPRFYIDPPIPARCTSAEYNNAIKTWEPCFLRVYSDHKIAFLGLNSAHCKKCDLLPKELLKKIEKGLREAEKKSGENSPESKQEKNNISTILDCLKKAQLTDDDDYGEISNGQLMKIQKRVEKMEKDYSFVALFHHHFSLFPEAQENQIEKSIIRRYPETLDFMQNMNVQTVLHGHKHFATERPIILDGYRSGKGTSSLNIIEVFSGGSVGASDAEMLSFSVIDFYGKEDKTKIIHHRFSYRRDKLEPVQKLTIDATNITKRKLENE